MPALTGRRAALLGAVVLALFVAWTVLTATHRFERLDRWAYDTSTLRGTATTFDVLKVAAWSASAEASVLWVLALGVAAVRVARLRRTAVVLVVALAAGEVVEVMLKVLVDHPPPPGSSQDPGLLSLPTSSSYPSGHALRAMLFAVTAIILLRGRRPAVLAACAVGVALVVLLVVVSRTVLVAHWATDVVGGVLLGAALAAALLAVAGTGASAGAAAHRGDAS